MGTKISTFINNDPEAFIALLALGVAIATFILSMSQEMRIRRMIKKNETPRLEIVHIYGNKIKIGEKGAHVRYTHGVTRRSDEYLSINNLITVEKLNEQSLKNLMKNKKKVYFTNFDDELSIMFNFLSEDEEIIVEHRSTKVVLRNTGAPIKEFAINSAKITYVSGEEVSLDGITGESKALSINKNEEIPIFIDEATNGFRHSVCELNSEVYKNINSETDLFDLTFDTYFLKYKKMEFNCTATNLENKEYNLKLIIEKSGNYLTHTTVI